MVARYSAPSVGGVSQRAVIPWRITMRRDCDDQPSKMTDDRELLSESDIVDDEPLTPGELDALTMAQPHHVTGSPDDTFTDDELLDMPDFHD